MQKRKRKKVVLAQLEAKLEKYQRRMQSISEEAYKVRQMIEVIKASSVKAEPEKENVDAIS